MTPLPEVAEPPRAAYAVDALRGFAAALFRKAGLDGDKPEVSAEVLVEADIMGHTTHGLALLPRYLQEIGSGSMAATGDPTTVSDRGACVCWDGRRLPGVWLTAKAVDLAIERVEQFGTVSVAIGNSHHLGCLAAYLPRATDRGFLAIVSSSDPSQRTVAPFGGRQPLFTPNPIAVGIPTGDDPLLIDVSASITTNNMGARMVREGRRFPGVWALDAAGDPTDDPKVLTEGGSILPAGGVDHGHKGYAWALIVEALTQGLAGFGRADDPKGWGACAFVQVIDPAAFGGGDAFLRQTSWLAEACRNSPPRPGVERVRVPGESALARRRDALARGVAPYPGVIDALRPSAERLGVLMPGTL
ncbi:MAG: Ldh family oxidoreductase [Gemmatimonadetes bacterium]|nr:Ldh family oxidoreductase [Gemmatimonadota bacterium]